MKKGKLIIFEGLDGSGKATQLDLLTKYLVKTYGEDKFVTYDFPRYYDNYWGGVVGRMLRGDFGTRINPYLRSIFYLLDQKDASDVFKKDLEQGKSVICNRYMTSSMIFQTGFFKVLKDKNEYLDWLETTAFKELNLVKPDLVLALSVDPEVTKELNGKKAARAYLKNKKDINEKNIQVQIHAKAVMMRLCKERKDWKLINCMKEGKLRTPEDISAEIKGIVTKII